MTLSDIETALANELHKIAPEVSLDDIDKTADLHEEFDIDSMDFLNLVTSISQRFKIAIPEVDYPKISSFDDLARYLKDQSTI